jgi:hypothetical protein
MTMNIYRLLGYPQFYNLTVRIFSLGGRSRKLNLFIDNLLSSECHGRVLELGSGTCQFRSLFLKYVGNYVATDMLILSAGEITDPATAQSFRFFSG